jgi:hypothetical protein
VSEKRYTLELTERELGDCIVINNRIERLRAQAKADRERDDLELPWKAVQHAERRWGVRSSGKDYWMPQPTERQAKLMSAAPELLEAVKCFAGWYRAAFKSSMDGNDEVERLIDRALRKVETGVPE